jgi:cytochrome P450
MKGGLEVGVLGIERMPLPRPWISDDGSLAVDLTNPETHVEFDLEPLFSFLREEHPVIWHPPHARQSKGFWAVTRHADAVAVCRDAETFSSEQGNVIETLLYGGDPAGGQMLAVSDGERHDDIRRLLWQGLTPDALQSMAGRIRENAKATIIHAASREACDFAHDVAAQLPLTGICYLLGVPDKDREFILDRTSTALASEGAESYEQSRSLIKGELLVYFDKLAQLRKRQPAADLISLLANGTIAGRKLTADEVVLNCYSLILGGDETTRLSMVGGIAALMDDPVQWTALRAGDIPYKSAADEIIRWTTPAMHVGRTVMRDVRICDVKINAGDVVIAWLSSANFDPREFKDPEVMNLRRRPNRQLSFSYGDHFCVGAHLARLEIGILLELLCEMVQDIEPAGTATRLYSNFLSGYNSLPVRMRLH